MPKVSIIVPFWGVEKYIAECIESITSQTFKDFELLLIDDCSKDQSRSIAEKYASTDSRIKIIAHEKNTGQGGARNTGLKEAQGKYIWYIDSDDSILENTSLEKVYTSAETNNVDVLLFDCIRTNKGKNEYIASAEQLYKGLHDSRSSVERFVISNFQKIHFVWNKLFTKEFLIKNHCYFLEHTNHQDSIQILWVFNAERAFYLPEAHYHYRLRDQSTMTTKKDARAYEHVCRMSEAYDSYYLQHMADSRNSRVLTFAKKIFFLLFAGATARCFINSSPEDRNVIAEMAGKNIKSSKLYTRMSEDEIAETLNMFVERKTLAAFESLLRKNQEAKASLEMRKLLRGKHGITFNKVFSKIQKTIQKPSL